LPLIPVAALPSSSAISNKVSRLSPQKWLIQRRLEAAHDKIRNDGKKVSDVCFEVGFKNLSHFSRVFKESLLKKGRNGKI
jgi:AraC-like DNA-binding protein